MDRMAPGREFPDTASTTEETKGMGSEQGIESSHGRRNDRHDLDRLRGGVYAAKMVLFGISLAWVAGYLLIKK